MKYILSLILIVGLFSCTSVRYSERNVLVVTTEKGFATCFRMDEFLITCNHAVKDGTILVTDYKGVKEEAYVVARDTVHDIAVMRTKRTYATDYDVSEVRVGKPLTVIGHPAGFYWSQLEGYVQAIRREDGINYIQIGTSSYFGLSGAPVIDGKGRLVGMVRAFIPGTQFTMVIPIQYIILFIKDKDP